MGRSVPFSWSGNAARCALRRWRPASPPTCATTPPAGHWTTTEIVPAVLVVFDDDLAAGHFLRLAEQEMRRAGVKVPLWVSHRAALEGLGLLGPAWQRPGSYQPGYAFPNH